MGIIESIFSFLTEIVDGFIGIFATLFSNEGILVVFYDSVTGLTFMGALLLIGVGFMLTRWAFSFIKNLLKMRM